MLLALSLFGASPAFRLHAHSYLCQLGSGTIFCGFAPSMETLIIARAIAGMGGGG